MTRDAGQNSILRLLYELTSSMFCLSAAENKFAPSKGEQAQWTKQYLQCAAELSQWEVVAEYASVTENYAQLADCLWRLHDWIRLKDLVLPKAMVSAGPHSCLMVGEKVPKPSAA